MRIAFAEHHLMPGVGQNAAATLQNNGAKFVKGGNLQRDRGRRNPRQPRSNGGPSASGRKLLRRGAREFQRTPRRLRQNRSNGNGRRSCDRNGGGCRSRFRNASGHELPEYIGVDGLPRTRLPFPPDAFDQTVEKLLCHLSVPNCVLIIMNFCGPDSNFQAMVLSYIIVVRS
ncbi:hypothetical protein SDC9_160067 [bioreactor metagenome]|uniref:Uncharacterized protein n=1 Tax=bioreactor metagenome TaxID=1076179 RepID=A0A645FEL7_9ZZZZ